jgi:hypothetical protein
MARPQPVTAEVVIPKSGAKRALAADTGTIPGGSGLIDAGVASDVSRRAGLVDPRIHAGPGPDVPRRSGLVDARVPTNVPCGPGLVDAGVASHIPRRPGLIDARVTGVHGNRQGCSNRTEHECAQTRLRYEFHLSVSPWSPTAPARQCSYAPRLRLRKLDDGAGLLGCS